MKVQLYAVYIVVGAKLFENRVVIVPHLGNHVVEQPNVVFASPIGRRVGIAQPILGMLAPEVIVCRPGKVGDVVVVVHAIRDEEVFARLATGIERLLHRIATTVDVLHDMVERSELGRHLLGRVFLPLLVDLRRIKVCAPRGRAAHHGVDIRILELLDKRCDILPAVVLLATDNQQLMVEDALVVHRRGRLVVRTCRARYRNSPSGDQHQVCDTVEHSSVPWRSCSFLWNILTTQLSSSPAPLPQREGSNLHEADCHHGCEVEPPNSGGKSVRTPISPTAIFASSKSGFQLTLSVTAESAFSGRLLRIWRPWQRTM